MHAFPAQTRRTRPGGPVVPTALWMGLALALGCENKPEQALTVVVSELPLRSATGAEAPVVATVPLGSPLRGVAPGFLDDKNHWKIRLNDGRMVYAPLESAMVVQGQPVTLYAAAPEVERLKEPYPRGAVLERVPAGTAISVLKDQPFSLPGFGNWMVGGVMTGFVRLDRLQDKPLTTADLVERVRVTLVEGRWEEAAGYARAAALLDEKDIGAQELATAVLAARGDPEAGFFRRRAGERKETPPKADPDLAPGVQAVVVAPTLAARRGPTLTAPVVMRLNINTTVVVKGVDKAWARVVWKGAVKPQLVEVEPFAPPPEEEEKKPPAAGKPPSESEVYVHAGWLGPAPLARKELRAAIKEHVAAGDWAAASLALQQVLALDPGDKTAPGELLDAAMRAGQYDVAVQAALRRDGQAFSISGFDVENVEWLVGCKGYRAGSVAVSPSDEELVRGKARPSTCAREVDVEPPCAPCESWNESAVDAAMFDREMMRVRDLERTRMTAAGEAAAARARAHPDRVAALARQFPEGPYCHVRLRNRQTTRSPDGLRLVTFSVDPTAAGEARVRTALVKVPVTGPMQLVDLWLKMESRPGMRCGLVNARNADAARKSLLAHLDGGKDAPPLREAVRMRRTCDCFGRP